MITTIRSALCFCLTGFIAASAAHAAAPTNMTLSGTRHVFEMSATGTFVGNLGTIDADAGETFTYTFTEPHTSNGGRFKLVGAQVQVDNGALLDFEKKPGYPIAVRSTDHEGLSTDKVFTIWMDNANDAPHDLILTGAHVVGENAEPGTVIGQMYALDQDAVDSYTYVFVAPELNDGGRFALAGDNLVVGNTPLNRDEVEIRSVRVRATDSGGLQIDKTADMLIVHYPEAPSNITLSGDRTVSENAAAGALIGGLGSIDADYEDTFTYSLIWPEFDFGGLFQIVGAQLQIGDPAQLDYEVYPNSYPVRIQTTDSTGLQFDKTFTISVTDGNDAPTNIGLGGSRAVNENAANGTVVGALSTVDPNPGNSFAYDFVAPESNAGGRFAAVGAQLRVGNGALLDYEIKRSHAIRVRSTDQGGLSTQKVFTIAVNDLVE